MMTANVQDIADGVVCSNDGIWYADGDDSVSYPSHGHGTCLAVEEGSFWFNHRNAAITELVQSFPPEPGQVILDVGGGNGFVSLALEAAGWDVILIEPGTAGAQNARSRGVQHVVSATTETAGVRDNSVGAIGLFDVIEHIEDDVAFLNGMRTLLRGAGRVYATVPAYQSLWSADDVHAGHFRRYSIDQISDVFDRAGFDVDYATHFFRPLPIPVFLFRSLPGRFKRTDDAVAAPRTASSASRSHAAGGGLVARTVQRLLRPEISNISERRRMRFGGSILITARRR